MNSLKEKYLKEIRKQLMDEFGINNVFAVPKITKIVVNMGISEAKDNSSILDKAAFNLTALSGQKVVITRAKKSIAAFKLSKGASIGLMATLRDEKMYSFFEKLVSIVLPKVRDFRGISDSSFDNMGNFNLGLKELLIFPEVDYKNVDKQRGLQITINTSAKNKEQGKRLMELLGMPFKKTES